MPMDWRDRTMDSEKRRLIRHAYGDRVPTLLWYALGDVYQLDESETDHLTLRFECEELTVVPDKTAPGTFLLCVRDPHRLLLSFGMRSREYPLAAVGLDAAQMPNIDFRTIWRDTSSAAP